MKERPSFVTIFTEAQNFHLVKDVGQIPYHMQKEGGFDSKLVCYQNDATYPYLATEVKGLTVEFIANRGKIGAIETGIIHYLFRKSREIDILHLFHFRRDHLAYILLYKFLNPNGRVYIKLDLDIRFFKRYDAFLYSRHTSYNLLLKRVQHSIIQGTFLFSVESTEAYHHIRSVIPSIRDKLIFVPNALDGDQVSQLVRAKSFDKKENIIITVGRVGTYPKNTEFFLESLLNAKLKDWVVYIIGPETPDFKTIRELYFEKHPEMQSKIVFIGNVIDRAELMNWYNRAKVFCLTSRFEGFPLCLPEAAWFGNYIISTDLASAYDISDQGKFGKIVHAEPGTYGNAITEILTEGFLSESLAEQIRQHASDHFSWKSLIGRLTKLLRDA